MSLVSWNQTNVNLIAHPFHAWIETMILDDNNLFNFILTSGFGDGCIFHSFIVKNYYLILLKRYQKIHIFVMNYLLFF